MYLILDLETSTYTEYGRKANPFCKKNYIVSFGSLSQSGKKVLTHINRDKDVVPTYDWLKGITCIVGINLKFDLLYLWNDPHLQAFFKRGGRIYDCQYAQYLVTAQQHKWASMNDMAAIYGGTQKEDKIKEYWENGVQTIDIPEEELLEYLDYDLINTEIIFKGVTKKAKEFGMINTIRAHMDGLCATIEMEYNGLKIDMDTARRNQKELENLLKDLGKEMEQYAPEVPEGLEFNFNSGEHLSALLFGGDLKYKIKEPVLDENGKPTFAMKTEKVPCKDPNGEIIYYKSGKKVGEIKYKSRKIPDPDKPKMKYVEKSFTLPGMTKPKSEWALAKDGFFKTDNKVIQILADRGVSLAKLLLEYKKYDKDLGTYYERDGKGMLTLVDSNNIIHHSLNNVQTATGRLSSSNPNAQNLPRGNTSSVREMFVSRFPDGVVGEIDYSQLEVVVQAMLTNDDQLIQDCNDGVDFHCKRLAAKLHEDYEDVLHKVKVEKDPEYILGRTLAKGFSFQRAYGAGKKAIAASTGMSEDEVQQLIDAEEMLYPAVIKYNKWVEKTVEKNKVRTDLVSKSGHPLYYGWHPTPTGKRYGFVQEDAPSFMHRNDIYVSFKPTEMKNYSVQGAAGEIVLTVLGRLWRHFLERDNYDGKAILVNTVHDCVWVDMQREVSDNVIQDMTRIMVSVPQIYKEVFNIDVPVEFRVEAEVGPNMKDLH